MCGLTFSHTSTGYAGAYNQAYGAVPQAGYGAGYGYPPQQGYETGAAAYGAAAYPGAYPQGAYNQAGAAGYQAGQGF